MSVIRTRFAPSPTGDLHVGGARTALFSWLFARHHQGQFFLRIEDTDKERSTPEALQNILAGLDWLTLDYDANIYYQSQRTQRYHYYLEKLLSEGSAYFCYCSTERLHQLRERQRASGNKPRYDGHCRYHAVSNLPNTALEKVIRFKNPTHGVVTIDDRVLGNIQFNNAELDDFILARSDGTPTYNFTVVVDDYELGITHIIRGNDHVNNTPKQVNLLKALQADIPIYMHLPMIHAHNGKKLSKRHNATSLLDYQTAGFLKEAMLNYLARLGWSHGDQEIFSTEELIRYFDGYHLSKSPAIFNPNKLLWLNQHYLKQLDPYRVAQCLEPFTRYWSQDDYTMPALSDIVLAQRSRVKTLKEMAEKSQFISSIPDTALPPLDTAIVEAIQHLCQDIEQLIEWNQATIDAALKKNMEYSQLTSKQLFPTLRHLLVGATISPPMDTTIELLGKQRVLARLQRVYQ